MLEEIEEFVLESVEEELNGSHHLASGEDPEKIEVVADHAAYKSMKTVAVPEITIRDARGVIQELIGQGGTFVGLMTISGSSSK